MFPRKAGSLTIALIVLVGATAPLWAFKDFVMPKAENANTYPSKDVNPDVKVTTAVDVYNTSAKDDVFGTKYVEQGILPVFLVVTNEGDKPISLTKMEAQLVTARHAKLESLSADDILRRVSHVHASSTNPGRAGSIPIPGMGKNKKSQAQLEEINRAKFSAFAVEPHTTQSGFLFFDIQDVANPVQGAHIYLTGVRDASGHELMYFDIPVTGNK